MTIPPFLHTALVIFNISWQDRFAYKFGFALWRLRQLLTTILAITIWSVLFAGDNQLFNYEREQMITYIFLAAIMHSLILTSALHNLSGDVYSGKISTLLIKPISLFKYLGIYEISDKLLNFSFLIFEVLIIFWWLQPTITLPTLSNGLVFLVWLPAGLFLNFLITLLFGALGFWSNDVWGPKFIFFTITEFTAGRLFPLDILPQTLQSLIYLTPFPYLSYAQTQVFLGRLDSGELIANSLALLCWILALAFLTRKVWSVGLKNYSAAGQ